MPIRRRIQAAGVNSSKISLQADVAIAATDPRTSTQVVGVHILEQNEAPAEHLCLCVAVLGAGVANFSRDLAIFFATKNELGFGCTSVCADRSEKPGFSPRHLLHNCAARLIGPRRHNGHDAQGVRSWFEFSRRAVVVDFVRTARVHEGPIVWWRHPRESRFVEMIFQRATGEQRHAVDDGSAALAAGCPKGDMVLREKFYQTSGLIFE